MARSFSLSTYRPSRRLLLWSLLLVLLLLPQLALAAPSDGFEAALEQGLLSAIGFAFIGGLLVSLTPCVYPMIAITVSVFGARQTKNHWQGLALSSVFVLGIVAMMTPLGVGAGLSGAMFGSVLQYTWVNVAISALFLAMAASMLGAFEMTLPSGLTNRLAQVGGSGFKGAFGLGLVCGLIAAPCTGPVLTGILTFIAKSQSASLGAMAMAAFSLGLGLPFLLVGTFAMRLPKSGAWMIGIKSFFAVVLATVGLYFLGNALFSKWVAHLPAGSNTVWLGVALVGGGFAIGAIHRDFASPGIKDRLLKGIGVAAAISGALLAVFAFVAPERVLNWNHESFAAAHSSAARAHQPMLVDFTASWCGACKELDKLTFADPDVSRAAGRFYAVKVDATDDEDPVVASTMKKLGVVGLPTVLLFDSTGNEVKRFTDFVEAKTFLEALESVD